MHLVKSGTEIAAAILLCSLWFYPEMSFILLSVFVL